MLFNKYVDQYIRKWKSGELILNEKRIRLLKLIEEEISPRGDMCYFDEEQINNYIKFSQAWCFDLNEWEKFVSTFIFLFYKEEDEVISDEFVVNMGRGGDKNGFISTLAGYFVSSLHGIDYYDVSIVANNEKQAKRSFQECYRVVNKKGNEGLKKEFEACKSSLTGLETQSIFEYKTSNVSSQDDGREGAVTYDEYREMENTDTVDVFSGRLGRVDRSRQFLIGTKGFVREEYFDIKYREREDILNGLTEFKDVFPYIYELDDIEEMGSPECWAKANPALQLPPDKCDERFFNEMMKKYRKLSTESSGRVAFITKRISLLEDNMENSVATKEEIMATSRPFSELDTTPTGAIDFGSVRDFATPGLLLKNRKKDEYALRTFTFTMKYFCDVHYDYSLKKELTGTEKRASTKIREKMGLMRVVDEPSLNPKHIVDWFIEARKEYGVRIIVMDNCKADILGPMPEKERFGVIRLKRPSNLYPLLAPRVEDEFTNHKSIFGNNPLTRWFTNNMYVKETQVSKQFLKEEKVKRKADRFQALVHALYKVTELDDQIDYDNALDTLSELDF